MLSTKPLPYIILRQQRTEKAFRSPDGLEFLHTIVDFSPIVRSDTKAAHILPKCASPDEALALARLAYPRYLLAVQPALEYLQCHQKPKLSQSSLNSNGQRLGR
jgi:hypothetical protein